MVNLVNLNISNYHSDNNEVKIASRADMHTVGYRTFQVEKQQKINKLVIRSKPKLKCTPELKCTLAHLTFRLCKLKISSKKAIFCSWATLQAEFSGPTITNNI